MKTSQKGSVIVGVLLVVTIVMVCSINALKNISLMHELMYKQQHYQKIMWAAEGLLRYGVYVCTHSKEPLIHAMHQQETIVMPHWPDQKSLYSGIITITPVEQDAVRVRAILKKDTEVLCAFHCTVQQDKQIIVSEWTLED